MARTYTNFYKNSLLTGGIDFDNDSFAVSLCSGSPGTAATVSGQSQILNLIPNTTSGCSISRAESNLSIATGSFGVVNYNGFVDYLVFANTTKNVVCWWEDGVGLNADAATEVLFSGVGDYIFTI